MPTGRLLSGWSDLTPEHFRFTLKAPRRITHEARFAQLRGPHRRVLRGRANAGAEARRSAVPVAAVVPEKTCRSSTTFLAVLPPGVRAAFEFRHASWHDPAVFERLRSRQLALCIADSGRMTTPLGVTAGYAYFRLRDEGYRPEDIARWAETIAAGTRGCREVFVYFKHEDKGKGPEFARQFVEALPASG